MRCYRKCINLYLKRRKLYTKKKKKFKTGMKDLTLWRPLHGVGSDGSTTPKRGRLKVYLKCKLVTWKWRLYMVKYNLSDVFRLKRKADNRMRSCFQTPKLYSGTELKHCRIICKLKYIILN